MLLNGSTAFLLAWLVAFAACGPTPSRTSSSPPAGGKNPSASQGPTRLEIAIGGEVKSFIAKFESANTYRGDIAWTVNSPLSAINPEGVATPLLAASLPSRDDGTWIVHPDGRMQTLWRIRPDAVWHDRHPISAGDFSFALRVYTDDQLPVGERSPEQFMDRIEAQGPKAFLIHWKQPYPWANQLSALQLEPLPEHLMGTVYAAGDRDAFVNHPFWSSPEYVGSGPYRLVQWDPGNQLVFRAFDDYFRGRPKIDEVIFRVIPDPNTVVSNLLAGTTDMTVNITLRGPGAVIVKQQWDQSGDGRIILNPVLFTNLQIQRESSRVGTAALLDRRVRRALAHGIDRESLAEIATEGLSPATEVPVVPTDAIYRDVLQAVTKYPYDRSRAAALLQEVGWVRLGDALIGTQGEPLALDIRTTSGNENEMAIIAADLGKLGIETSQTVIPQARLNDLQYRVTFPGLNRSAFPVGAPRGLDFAYSDQCGRPERRYVGLNRGCWSNADYDHWYEVANTSLDARERGQAWVQALRVLTEDVGVIGLSYTVQTVAVRKGLVGPQQGRWPGGQSSDTMNIFEWRWE